MTAIFVK